MFQYVCLSGKLTFFSFYMETITDSSDLMLEIEKKLSEIGITRSVDSSIRRVSSNVADLLDKKIFTFYQKILIRSIAIRSARKYLNYKK